LAEELEGEAVFVGVSNNDTVAAGKRYAEELRVPYALAHAPEVWAQFGDPFRPTTIVIGPDGRIASTTTGPITYEGLKADVAAVL
jgi:peroxiredoxin